MTVWWKYATYCSLCTAVLPALHHHMLPYDCNIHICIDIYSCDDSRESWYLTDWMLREPSQSRELSKRLFIGPAGSWTAVSPMVTLQPGRHTGGQSRVSALALEVEPAFWWSSGWHQQQTGLSSGKEGDHAHTHTHTLCHTPAEEQTEAGRKGCSWKAAVVWRWLSCEWEP